MSGLSVGYVLGTTGGGTGRHVAMLADGVAAEGVAVTVYAPPSVRRWLADRDGAAAAGGKLWDFVPVDIADSPRPIRDAAATLRLRGLLAAKAPGVVHAHGLRAGAAAALALAGGAARRTALAVTVHNGPPSGAGAAMVYAGLERLVASRADAVLTVSGDLADRMRRLGARDAGRAVVPAETGAPPGAAIAADLRSELGAMDRPIVLAVGRLAEQKGLSTLLTAAARWQYRRPVPLLVIAGEGPLASLLAEQARVQGVAVMFLGNRADVPALLAAADVVVVPSVWEGQPLIVQEALRAGRPLVASRVGGIPDLTGLGGALLVPPSDPAQLAAAVTRVLDRPDLAATLSAAASARAQLLPTREQAIQQAMSLYRRLSAERGARP